MWGIGLAISLFLMAIGASWAISGDFHYSLRGFGYVRVGVVREADSPAPFWTIVGFLFSVGLVGAIITGLGLANTQRQEKQNEA
jgi:hypothetical protein